MLLVFLLVLLVLCVCVFWGFFFSRDSNMISIGTVEFIYCVAIIIPVNLGKP